MIESLVPDASEVQEPFGPIDFKTALLLDRIHEACEAKGHTDCLSMEQEFELASRFGLAPMLRRHSPGTSVTGAGGSAIVDWIFCSTPHRGEVRDALNEGLFAWTLAEGEAFLRDFLSPLVLWVMDLPASESNHHSYPNGLLDHSLEVALAVLADCGPKMRHKYYEKFGLPRGYICALRLSVVLGLLHDIGKVFNVEVRGEKTGEIWSPTREPLAFFKARQEMKILGPTPFRFLPGRGLNGHEERGRELLPLVVHPRIWKRMGPAISAAYDAYAGRYETPTQARPAPLDFIADCVHRADGTSAARSLARGSKTGEYLLELAANAGRLG